jgi:hypothetical protein
LEFFIVLNKYFKYDTFFCRHFIAVSGHSHGVDMFSRFKVQGSKFKVQGSGFRVNETQNGAR